MCDSRDGALAQLSKVHGQGVTASTNEKRVSGEDGPVATILRGVCRLDEEAHVPWSVARCPYYLDPAPAELDTVVYSQMQLALKSAV